MHLQFQRPPPLHFSQTMVCLFIYLKRERKKTPTFQIIKWRDPRVTIDLHSFVATFRGYLERLCLSMVHKASAVTLQKEVARKSIKGGMVTNKYLLSSRRLSAYKDAKAHHLEAEKRCFFASL